MHRAVLLATALALALPAAAGAEPLTYLYVCDESNQCVRQEVPLDATTGPRYADAFSLALAATSPHCQVLNDETVPFPDGELRLCIPAEDDPFFNEYVSTPVLLRHGAHTIAVHRRNYTAFRGVFIKEDDLTVQVDERELTVGSHHSQP